MFFTNKTFGVNIFGVLKKEKEIKINAVLWVIVFFAAVMSGCGKKSDKVQGIWKQVTQNAEERAIFLEIGKDYFELDGGRVEGIVLEDIDEIVMVRDKSNGNDVMRLVLNDDGTMGVDILLKGKFERATKAELDADKAARDARINDMYKIKLPDLDNPPKPFRFPGDN